MSWFITSLGVAAVLMSGLVSCSPEKHRTDVFDVSARLVHDRREVDLKSFEGQMVRKVDVQDKLEFSTVPTATAIHTNCTKAGKNFYKMARFSGRSSISVFEFLPKKILTSDFKKTPVQCEFTVIPKDKVGSQRILRISMVAMSDERPYPVLIHKEPVDPNVKENRIPLFSYNDISQVVIRYQNRGDVMAKLICNASKFHGIEFDQMLSLNDFDLSKAYQTDPHQNCRIEMSQYRQTLALSRLVKIEFPQSPLAIQQIPPSVSVYPKKPNQNDNYLGGIKVTNPTNETRIFRIPSGRLPLKVRSFPAPHQLYIGDLSIFNWEVLTPQVQAPNKVKQQSGYWVIELAPKSSVIISASFVSQGQHEVQCPDDSEFGDPVPNFESAIAPAGPVAIDSLDGQGHVSDSVQTQIGSAVGYLLPDSRVEYYLNLPVKIDYCQKL